MLDITITGDPGAGKTQLAAVIMAALSKAGYVVNHLSRSSHLSHLADHIQSGEPIPQDGRAVTLYEVDADRQTIIDTAREARLESMELLQPLEAIAPPLGFLEQALADGRNIKLDIS